MPGKSHPNPNTDWNSDTNPTPTPCTPAAPNAQSATNALFGYILGNRDGIDNWHLIPGLLRRSLGHKLAPVRSVRGVIEKNIEVRIGRRFKRQGRSWSRNGAEHLAQLLWLQTHPTDWTHWWSKTALSRIKINPGWLHAPHPPTDN